MSAAGHQSISLQAGVPFTLGSGNFFQILTQSGTDKIKVIFSRNSSQLLDSVDAASAGFYAKPKPDLQSGQVGQDTSFDSVILTSATAQTLEVLVLAGEAGSNIFSGAVSVSNTVNTLHSDELSLGGTAFITKHSVSGTNPQIQLYNPVASGKILLLDKVHYSTTGTAQSNLFFARSLANTLDSAGLPPIYGKESAGSSVAEIYQRITSTYPAAPIVSTQTLLHVRAEGNDLASKANLIFKDPVVIKEGEGFVSFHAYGTVIADYLNFEFREIDA